MYWTSHWVLILNLSEAVEYWPTNWMTENQVLRREFFHHSVMKFSICNVTFLWINVSISRCVPPIINDSIASIAALTWKEVFAGACMLRATWLLCSSIRENCMCSMYNHIICVQELPYNSLKGIGFLYILPPNGDSDCTIFINKMKMTLKWRSRRILKFVVLQNHKNYWLAH